MADPLTPMERRILGTLVEKALTAAISEPLTLNSVIVGCNQKSARDPQTSYEEPEVDDCLDRMKRRGLVVHVIGGRAERWRHDLYDAWKVDKAELAILVELLLRGPQTMAEARTRASRMTPIDHDSMAEKVRRLVELGYVVWLSPEHRRGAMLTHGFYDPVELDKLRSRHGSAGSDEAEPMPGTSGSPSRPSGPSDVAARSPSEIPVRSSSDVAARSTSDGLSPIPSASGHPAGPNATAEIQELRTLVLALAERVRRLEESLGVSPPD